MNNNKKKLSKFESNANHVFIRLSFRKKKILESFRIFLDDTPWRCAIYLSLNLKCYQ